MVAMGAAKLLDPTGVLKEGAEGVEEAAAEEGAAAAGVGGGGKEEEVRA
jgi:hypothetical protein